MAPIGHDEIEVLVAIKVADPQGSGNVRFDPELESEGGDKAPPSAPGRDSAVKTLGPLAMIRSDRTKVGIALFLCIIEVIPSQK